MQLTSDVVEIPTCGKAEREHWLEWIIDEQKYEEAKYSGERGVQDTDMAENGLMEDGYWNRYILRYLSAAALFSRAALDTGVSDEGRERAHALAQQALAKTLMTVRGALESSIRVWGPLPKPGLSSGYIEKWDFEPSETKS